MGVGERMVRRRGRLRVYPRGGAIPGLNLSKTRPGPWLSNSGELVRRCAGATRACLAESGATVVIAPAPAVAAG
jgi:hypothetical protein